MKNTYSMIFTALPEHIPLTGSGDEKLWNLLIAKLHDVELPDNLNSVWNRVVREIENLTGTTFDRHSDAYIDSGDDNKGPYKIDQYSWYVHILQNLIQQHHEVMQREWFYPSEQMPEKGDILRVFVRVGNDYHIRPTMFGNKGFTSANPDYPFKQEDVLLWAEEITGFNAELRAKRRERDLAKTKPSEEEKTLREKMKMLARAWLQEQKSKNQDSKTTGD